MTNWSVAGDLATKAANDAVMAVQRTAALSDDGMEKFKIYARAACAMIGMAGGAFAAVNDLDRVAATEAVFDLLRDVLTNPTAVLAAKAAQQTSEIQTGENR